jgi:hypothetical protein
VSDKAQKKLSGTCDRQEHANSSSRSVAPWPTFLVRSNTKKTTIFVVGLRSDGNVNLIGRDQGRFFKDGTREVRVLINGEW